MRSRNEPFGFIAGGTYVALGIAGYLVAGDVPFAGSQGGELLGIEVNPLRNLVHLLFGGMVLAGAAGGAALSQRVNRLAGVSLAAVGILGLLVADTRADVLALDAGGNVLHLVTALLAIAAGYATADSPATERPVLRQIGRTRPPGALLTGDVAETSGAYRCSCGEFAVFILSGYVFPQCPVGLGHHYRLVRAKMRTTA